MFVPKSQTNGGVITEVNANIEGRKKHMKKISLISILIIISFLGGSISFAQSLPDTGQVASYTSTFGEDSDYDGPTRSYSKLDSNGNVLDDSATSWAMVQDNVTGLIWEIKTDDGGIHDKDDYYKLSNVDDDFIAELNSECFGGYSDWRLPTILELSMLVDVSISSPAIDQSYFPNMGLKQYLSSTVYANTGTYGGWVLYLNPGCIMPFVSYGSAYVLAVRGDQLQGELVDNGDGTVTDTRTGLMWQQDDGGQMNWLSAINYCENLDLAGYSDWRMPNRNELQSLVDYSEYNPAINTAMFSDPTAQRYWASTSLTSQYAWCLITATGQLGYDNATYVVKSYLYNSVRAVRGGLDN